jgi:hypothetical protein
VLEPHERSTTGRACKEGLLLSAGTRIEEGTSEKQKIRVEKPLGEDVVAKRLSPVKRAVRTCIGAVIKESRRRASRRFIYMLWVPPILEKIYRNSNILQAA